MVDMPAGAYRPQWRSATRGEALEKFDASVRVIYARNDKAGDAQWHSDQVCETPGLGREAGAMWIWQGDEYDGAHWSAGATQPSSSRECSEAVRHDYRRLSKRLSRHVRQVGSTWSYLTL